MARTHHFDPKAGPAPLGPDESCELHYADGRTDHTLMPGPHGPGSYITDTGMLGEASVRFDYVSTSTSGTHRYEES